MASYFTFGQVHNIQNKYVKIVYDFTKPGIPDTIFQYGHKIKIVNKAWYDRRVIFNFIINPYLYHVNLESSQRLDDAIQSKGAEKIFDALSNIDTASNILEANNSLKTNGPARENQVTDSTKVEDILKDSINDHPVSESFARRGLTSAFVSSLHKATYFGIEQNAKTFSKINNFQIKNRALSEVLDSLESYKIEKNDYLTERANFIKATRRFDNRLFELKQHIDFYEDLLTKILVDRVSQLSIVSALEEQFNKNSFNTIDGFLSQSSQRYDSIQNEIEIAFQEVKDGFESIKEVAAEITIFNVSQFVKTDSILFESYEAAFNRIKTSNTKKIISAIQFIVHNLKRNPDLFIQSYHSQLIEKDSVLFLIKKTPTHYFDSLIYPRNILSNSDSTFTYKLEVKGNLKLNLSVGMAFLHGSLKPLSYYFSPGLDQIPNDSDSLQIKVATQNNTFVPVIAAFAHAYYKFGGFLTPGLTIGVSANPTDLANSTYLLGLSLILGHQSRFIATFGIAGSSVDYLKGKYNLNTWYKKSELKNLTESDLSQKVFKSGFFFGFSYNISKKR